MRIRLVLMISALTIQASAVSVYDEAILLHGASISNFEESLLVTPGKIDAAEENMKLEKSTLTSEEQMMARQMERAELQSLRQKISNRIMKLEKVQESYADVEDSGGMIAKIGQYIEILSEKMEAAINDVSALRELDLESEKLVTDSM